MLINRGYREPEAAWSFLEPSLDTLHDPFLMKGMNQAVSRIREAGERGDKIIIYGDYDADGITSVAVLKRALELLGMHTDYYIPRRLEDGYGLRNEALDKIAAEGYRLVITVDCGIRAIECAKYAGELGLDLIITDHHLPVEESPSALAVLNPKQEGCPYPFKELAGVGVVFKLVQALFSAQGKDDLIPHFLKLVAIGTVADMVPLNGENRVVAYYGLLGLSNLRNPGLKNLLSGSGVGFEVSSQDVGFKIAPRLNAYTRMGGGSEIVELFFLADQKEVSDLVRAMDENNTSRKKCEQEIVREIDRQLVDNPVSEDQNFLLFAGKGWHRGVIGNVASKMVNRFYRPCLVLSVGTDSCQGSGRSIPGFHLLKALASCDDLLYRYGGHAQAIGCSLDSVDPEHLEKLRKRLDEYAAAELSDEDKTPVLKIDSYIPVENAGIDLLSQIRKLEPFGKANPEPVFASRNVEITAVPRILKGRHLKLQTRSGGQKVDMIWWQKDSFPRGLGPGSKVDVAYTLKLDNYRSESGVYLNIRDLRVF